MSNTNRTDKSVRFALLNAVALAGLMASPALAQEAPTTETTSEEEIVVTGYRASLRSSTEAKRSSVAVLDSVFAEDIGKFPDLTIAESLNRIPGVQIIRDVNGDGYIISVRGLGNEFTKIMMNGAQIAVASSGALDAQNQNREVDLSLFPTELFARLDVQKTPMASNLEGGVAGIVNMRAARPFDYEDDQLTYQLQGNYGESSGDYSWRTGAVGSMRFDTSVGEIGILGGVALVRNKYYVTGFETIGWTNPSLSDAQCGAPAATCNTTGGNNWTIPATVPAGAGGGLVAGTTIDAAYLRSLNPGIAMADLGNALIPRLGRGVNADGDRDRDAGVIGLQWRPNDNAEIYLDVMGVKTNREFERIDMNWVGRFGAAIPIGLQLDENNVVTSGTFANAQFFLEARPYHEEIEFLSVNPGASFTVTDWLEWNVAANFTRSNFFRRDPTILVVSPLGAGVTVTYNNPGEPFPSIVANNFDLNDPDAGWLWNGGRVNLSQEKRVTFTEGFHTDLRFGDSENNVRVGAAWDEIGRTISARNNDAAWENFVCRNGFDGVGTRPACAGGPGSAIEQSELASYLLAGPGFITVDFDRFLADTNYAQLSATAPEVNNATTNAASGKITEGTLGLWIEANGRFDIFDRPFVYNIGVREIETKQTIEGPVTVNGVRQYRREPSTYNETLPSVNVAYDILEDVKLRFAAARTLARPNPSQMLPTGQSRPGAPPNITFTDPSAQNATQSNPALLPYSSDNFDLAAEWYTGGEGYVALTGFYRKITGFTGAFTYQLPFSQMGLAFTDLSATQQNGLLAEYANSGSPLSFDDWLAARLINITQQRNSGDALTIKGLEVTWVQPLDFIIEGLGFTANYTNVDQEAEGVAPAIALGISPYTYNWTGYYENFGFSFRASYTYQDTQQGARAPQNGIPTAGLFADARGQWDLSASYTFEALPTSPQLTLNVTNLTSEPLRTYFEFPNATFTYYEPGYNVLLGIRGTF